MKYMLLCYDDEQAWEEAGAAALDAARQEAVALTHELDVKGQYVAARRCSPQILRFQFASVTAGRPSPTGLSPKRAKCSAATILSMWRILMKQFISPSATREPAWARSRFDRFWKSPGYRFEIDDLCRRKNGETNHARSIVLVFRWAM